MPTFADSRLYRRLRLLAGAFLVALLTLVVPAPAAVGAPPRVLTIRGSDYRFKLSSRRIAAGLVTVKFHNDGKAPHDVVLAKLRPGTTIADYLRASAKEHGATGEAKPLNRLVDYIGGAGTILPNSSEETYQQLTPGQYLALCLLPSHMGKRTHAELGMITSFRVVGKANHDRRGGVQGTLANLSAYDFRFHAPTRLHNHNVYRFTNAHTAQVHEALIVRVQPGKTIADIKTWFRAVLAHTQEGPPPYRFAGGSGWLSHGQQQWLKLSLAPGRYALICEVPDDRTGIPHAAMGMIAPLTVVR